MLLVTLQYFPRKGLREIQPSGTLVSSHLASMANPKFTVAIVGGGIAGLTAAIAISRLSQNNNIKIDIYEASQAYTEIGAGVGLWKRSWEVYEKLGLSDQLAKICQDPSISKSPSTSLFYI